MKLLSTIEKGDLFEDEVYVFICDYVNSGKTFLNPLNCQFFKQKGYYSHSRKKNIKIDVSIESHNSSSGNLALLTLIECKNYNTKKVPVDDVEEFESKIRQISGKNVKGMMFSRSGFSSVAYDFAKDKKIALARLLSYDKVDWIIERTPKPIKKIQRNKIKNEQILTALTDKEYRGISESFFSMYESTLSNSFPKTFNLLISKNYNKDNKYKSSQKKKNFVPYLGQEDIEVRVENLLKFFKYQVVKNNYEIDLIKIMDYLVESHKVTFNFKENLGFNSQSNEVLGKIEIKSRKVYISNTLERNSPRWRFTLAHEIGHLLLHRKLNIPAYLQGHLDTEEIIDWSNKIENAANFNRLEWQANSFASSLLLPRELVYDIISIKLEELDIRNFHNGIIYLDEQSCNIKDYQNILYSMKMKFKVSYQSINYRLAQLGILNNQTKEKKISNILKDTNFSSIFGNF